MQREEKQLEAALDTILLRVSDLKFSIGSMVSKIENEYDTLNWPQFLDNFALISGQLTALSKMLAHDKSPPLRNLTVLPLHLTPERDEELVRLTEHRIPAFSHAIVPDYLRTKLDPEIELKQHLMEQKAVAMTVEQYQKQMSAYSKAVNHVWELVSKMREEWESEGSARGGTAQTSSVADTHALVAAVAMGKGLKPQQSVPAGMMVAPVGTPGGPMNPNPPGMGPMGKAPSSIKTNIKAANQIHPYTR